MGRAKRSLVALVGAALAVAGLVATAPAAGAQVVDPNIVVDPQSNRIGGYGWADGATIDLEIDDPANGVGVDYSAQTTAHPNTDPVHGDDFVFNLANTFDVQAGHEVRVSDGTTLKTHVVTALTITDVDPDTDTVSGTAAPGSDVLARGGGDPAERLVQANGSGNWTADFSVVGPEDFEQDLLDIQLGSCCVNAVQGDADGDQTEVIGPPAGVSPPPPGPVIYMLPNSELTDGQTVAVGGTGWSANAPLNIVECLSPLTGPDDCDPTTGDSVVTDNAGGFSTSYQVTQVINPTNGPVTDCSPSFACVLLVIDPAFGLSQLATQPLSFGVQTATVSGTVLDGADNPPGPTLGVVVCPGTTLTPGAPPPGCGFFLGNPNGTYTTSGLSAGTYTIGGFGSAGGAIVGAGTPTTRTLTEGEQLTDIDFVLGSRIEGHITDPDGAPLPDVHIRLLGGPFNLGGDLGVVTNAAGDYQTPYLGAGTWTLEFHDPVNDLVGQGTVTVAANATATLDLELGSAATIQGTVASPLNSAALCPGSAGVNAGCPGLQFVPADGSGNFALEGLIPGTYSVVGFTFGPPLQVSPTVVIDVAGGDVVDCAFTLDSGSCNGPGSATSAAENAEAGGTVTTDSGGTGATETDPVQAAVTTPSAGLVTIQADDVSGSPPEGFELLGEQITISAPDATVESPLVLVFRIDSSLIPAGQDHTTIQVFKDGSATPIPACTGAPQAIPDPCVADRQSVDGDAVITVLSSTASVWTFGVSEFDFSGFASPVNNPPTINTVNAGRAIPVKFSLGGDFGLDIFAEGYPKSRSVVCDTQAPIDEIETTETAGHSSLSYDPATDQYTYVWKTNSDWAGCRKLVVQLNDGTSHVALFNFK